MLKDLPAGIPDEAFKIVFARVAMQGAAQAEAMLAGLDAKHHREALEGILDTTAAKDPVAALALAGRYPDEVPEYVQRKMISRIMARDPQQGIAAILSVTENDGDGKYRDRKHETLHAAMEEWHQQDAAAATAWAQARTGPGESTAKAWLLERKADDDPQAAMAEFSKLQDAGAADAADLSRTARLIAGEVWKTDFPAARDWALSFPPGAARNELIPLIVDQWARQDPDAASQWITQLPAGQERDNSIEKLVGVIKQRDPASAFEWARSMQPQPAARRKAIIQDVLGWWAGEDVAAAEAAAAAIGEIVPDAP
jgi:hypothetical protein